MHKFKFDTMIWKKRYCLEEEEEEVDDNDGMLLNRASKNKDGCLSMLVVE
jgi:hypothetical protein